MPWRLDFSEGYFWGGWQENENVLKFGLFGTVKDRFCKRYFVVIIQSRLKNSGFI